MLMSYVVDAGRARPRARIARRALLQSRRHRPQRADQGGQEPRSLSTPSASTGRRNTPPSTPTSSSASGRCFSRGSPPSMCATSTRRWSGRSSPCSPTWSGAAFPSTGKCCRGCPANSRRKRPASKPRSTSLPARPSMSAARSRSATFCSARCGLPGGTKTKTGQWSTGARLLDELAEQGHELPQKILDWRQVSKLKSTYTDALPGLRQSDDASRAYRATRLPRPRPGGCRRRSRTCRTSRSAPRTAAKSAAPSSPRRATSSSPPIIRRSSCGSSPRSPSIEQLRKAFRDGLDIHAHDGVGNVRRAGEEHAGRSAPPRQGDQFRHHLRHFGLRPRQPARHRRARRPAPISRNISSASPASATTWKRPRRSRRRTAMCETLFGRKCHYPDIDASNASIRAFNERAAINARLQGTAADIIRRAMVRMDAALAKHKLSAQMLLQVHDELVFEVPDAEVEKTLPVVTQVMVRRAACRRCRCRCRCMSRPMPPTIGTRRTEGLAPRAALRPGHEVLVFRLLHPLRRVADDLVGLVRARVFPSRLRRPRRRTSSSFAPAQRPAGRSVRRRLRPSPCAPCRRCLPPPGRSPSAARRRRRRRSSCRSAGRASYHFRLISAMRKMAGWPVSVTYFAASWYCIGVKTTMPATAPSMAPCWIAGTHRRASSPPASRRADRAPRTGTPRRTCGSSCP